MKTLEELAEFIDSNEDWNMEANEIIEANKWHDETDKEYGICNDGKRRLQFDSNMNTEIVSMTKNATIRIDACMADDLSRTYGSVSKGVEQMYEQLQLIRLISINEVRGLFSSDEWKAIADSFNGTMADGMFRTNVGAFIAHLEDSERYEHTLTKWGVKLEDITAKIKTLKGANIEAIYTRVEDFWKDPKNLEKFSKW